MCNFTHLHVHSEYSALDGMGKVRELLETAKSLGQTALAITDHGSTSGLWEAQKTADELGMKAIHGEEFYYEREGDGKNGHLLVLAKNDKGLENIFKMQAYASKHNFYYKPRINWDILKDHAEGLIVTSACLGSAFNQYIMNGELSEATAWARKFQEVFGDDFYIELQPNNIPEQHTCNVAGIRIAKQLGIELVATNDVHYTFEDDCFPHEVILAMPMRSKMSDEKRFRFPSDDFWLKSEEEMYETFNALPREAVEQAMANTKRIEEKCNARIKPGKYLPRYYDLPEGMSEGDLLRELALEGARERKLDTNESYMADVENELAVIEQEGYSGYFLVVQDYVNAAKERGEPVGDGRGSGAGSKVAYNTRITEIPPHEYDLLFERFMSAGREPDFDVDFADQDAVFGDLVNKYGEDNVARIITFGRMTPKAVIRKVLSTFDHPAHIIKSITALVPDLCRSLADAYKSSPELEKFRDMFPTEWRVIERIENVISHESTHAGGVIVYEGLTSILPVKTTAENRNHYVVAWDKYMLEDLGHHKLDVLGLETLPILKRIVESVERETGEVLDLTQIDLEDPEIYDMLCKGEVGGVFQLEAQAQKVMEQQPRNFRDLIAINALIRPGVGDWTEYIERRQGKEWNVYDERRAYMDETLGTMTYQEQFLLDGHRLAGWGIAYADKNLRKNRDIRNDVALKQKFLDDSTSRGHALHEMEKVWAEIEDAVDGGYSFNKSHSASYAKLSYQTAYLKKYYPNHFYASIMSSSKTDGDGQDEIAGYIAEAKKQNITILPPDINHSGHEFVPLSNGIAYRITTIKHVGESAINHILSLRPIADFDDFLARREKRHVRQNVVVNLVKAGAFDFDNPDRAELLWRFDMSNRTKTQIKLGVETPRYAYDDKVKMAWEKEVLGMYLSQHPLEKYGFQPLESFRDGMDALQGGEIYDMRVFNDKKGNEMAFVHISTLYGNVKVLVFSRNWAYKNVKGMFVEGNIVLIKGRRSGNDLIFNEGEVLERAKVIEYAET